MGGFVKHQNHENIFYVYNTALVVLVNILQVFKLHKLSRMVFGIGCFTNFLVDPIMNHYCGS